MSQDTSSNARRLLPQSSQMSSFSFAPPTTYQQPPREQQKNYVFVDEHNRHKRLKVMRACEGCRRRKIKCDAATTNTWPCSACVRLKLHCVRPNGFDEADPEDQQTYNAAPQQYEAAPAAQVFRREAPLQADKQVPASQSKPAAGLYAAQTAYHDPSALYHGAQYAELGMPQNEFHYATVTPAMSMAHPAYPPQNLFPTPPSQHASRSDSAEAQYSLDQYGQSDLANLLGNLRVAESGTAPYLNSRLDKDLSREEEPAVEDADEFKSSLPPLQAGPGSKIRIPPALMPDDETTLHYLDLYFSHVHPYVPVLDKNLFLQQWHRGRDTLSPLLLEAIFAIAGRLADEPAQGQQWLALASRHADSFMDIPRLSTLQALMILLKAREAAPKRGYYYRSWMNIVQCVQMGKDLGLDEHESEHAAGRPCGFPRPECLLRSRIWQTIFVCEAMIGTPQGRPVLAVEIDTVDFAVPRPIAGGNDSEYQVSRGFTHFARIVRNVSRLSKAYNRVKNTKDWGMDPELLALGPSFEGWLDDVPADMRVSYPPDGSPPWLPSAFIGNLHSYYYLSIILLHRPQLTFLQPNGADGQWKHHMTLCYNSAKLLCRLQEAVLSSFGITAVQSMQRGINFTIYSVLTCIVLHLVAITSPDRDINGDAREYFTRHMRILEKCMDFWPVPEMQKQVNAVREAFSADIRKPFVLKPSFPYGSPSTSNSETASLAGSSYNQPPTMVPQGSIDGHLTSSQGPYSRQTVSPPSSTGPVDMRSDGLSSSTTAALGNGQQLLSEAPTWNPSRIFELDARFQDLASSSLIDLGFDSQWNTTFGGPPAPVHQSSSNPGGASQSGAGGAVGGAGAGPGAGPGGAHHDPARAPSVSNQSSTLYDGHSVSSGMTPNSEHAAPVQYPAPHLQTFVTPAMWQESVASVYEGGLKRGWDYDTPGMPLSKRR